MPDTALTEAFDRFLTSLAAAKKSPHTIAAYRRDLTAVAELLVDPINQPVEDLMLSDVTVPALRAAFGMRAEHSAPATMARTHSVWSRFYRFCRTEGLVVTSPVEEIEKVKTGTTRPRSIDAPDLATRMLEAATTPPPGRSPARWPTRDAAIVSTLMSTGVRLAELVDLHCQSLTGQPGEYQLDIVGKGAKYRAIPALDGLVERLTVYQKERGERFPRHQLDRRTTPLFVHPHTGQAVTARQVQYLLERLYREAGVRAQVPDGALVHALRHTFAMDLLDNGASIVEVQTLLGHESIATTRRYLTARPHQLRDAVAATSSATALRHKSTDGADA
ncbi:MAG: tyrosine-type recombinase/integrase [Acidimicrobiia bacterium]|nr:tyrosine-type recombinase/integrase [Acidimicrobiia bacterium]NNL98150.1 tyrosine-type recombinase/integrase [Acidimicrobiia bacterium]